ncbi:MAG: RNA polymerase sigma factor [Planctomycetota bacterium]|jgi:RNA polymerase sigma-70 factor (ECF subfamily)
MQGNEAPETLYERYRPRLRAYFVKHGLRRDQLDDAVQETFARLYAALAADRIRRSSVGGWLFATAKHVLADIRRDLARQARLHAALCCRDTDVSLRTAAEEREGCGLILGIVQKLPDDLRVPLVLRHKHGHTYREIARRLGISKNAVGIRLCRARKLLRARLKELDT